jgi:hypothetical protein
MKSGNRFFGAHRTSVAAAMRSVLTNVPGITFTAAPVELVTPEFAGSVADSLLTGLQLARSIVADEEMSVGKPQFTAWVQSVVVAQIDDCLNSGKETFPDAESFKFPPPPQQ